MMLNSNASIHLFSHLRKSNLRPATQHRSILNHKDVKLAFNVTEFVPFAHFQANKEHRKDYCNWHFHCTRPVHLRKQCSASQYETLPTGNRKEKYFVFQVLITNSQRCQRSRLLVGYAYIRTNDMTHFLSAVSRINLQRGVDVKHGQVEVHQRWKSKKKQWQGSKSKGTSCTRQTGLNFGCRMDHTNQTTT